MASIRRILIFSTFVAVSFKGYSQDQDPALAREYFEQAEMILEATQALDQVREVLVQAAETDTTFIRANFDAGHIHIQTIGKDQAVKYFLRVYRQDPDYNFGIEYWIARSYQYGLDFNNALRYYNLYLDKLKRKANYQGRDKIPVATVERAIKECENGKLYVSRPGNYSIVSIGREINSEYDDYGPVLNEREDEIVFTSRRREGNLNENVDVDNLPFEDIFFARKVNGVWQPAVNIGPTINTLYHESNLALSADGSMLFIYNDVGGGDILVSERLADGKSWGAPQPLPGIINSSFQEKSITISKDESTLYFVSNRPGGYGGTDIYRATKDSRGQWSNVKNLGPTINTPLDEEGPFIDYDGVTLYFSSQGHDGMGGHDIYRSTYDPQTDSWSTPVNMGYPINTPDNDVYFIVSANNERAYYSSVREDGMGYTDIYVITAEDGLKNTKPLGEPQAPKETEIVASIKNDPPVTTPRETVTEEKPIEQPKPEPREEPKEQPKEEIKPAEKKTEQPKPVMIPLRYVVKVVDAATKAPISAKVRLQGQRDNIPVGATTAGPGTYAFSVTHNTAKDYRLSVEAEGYVFLNQNLRLDGASTTARTLNRTVEMRKLSVGTTSVLRNIYFDYDRATFKTESYTELNKLDAMLRQNQNLRVEIAGHTDAYGRWDYNRQLSQRRAEAVKDYLVKRGIDPRRIVAVGYGESRPLASNDDEEEGRELNRRVEFKVLKN